MTRLLRLERFIANKFSKANGKTIFNASSIHAVIIDLRPFLFGGGLVVPNRRFQRILRTARSVQSADILVMRVGIGLG